MGIENVQQPDEQQFDFNTFLSGTSDPEPTGTRVGADAAQGSGEGGQQQQQKGYSFGGRSYADQKAAEQAHNQLYGRASEQSGLLNKIKSLLKTNPKAAQALLREKGWSDIATKLGIQQAEEDVAEEDAQDEDSDFDWSQIPAPIQRMYDQQAVAVEVLKLEREEWAFERQLGRPVKQEERDAVMRIISRAQSLTYAEAWKLAHHDRLLKEAQAKAQAQARPSQGNRPRPLSNIPGLKVDPKKSITDMTKAEWRENLRNSDEFKAGMSR